MKCQKLNDISKIAQKQSESFIDKPEKKCGAKALCRRIFVWQTGFEKEYPTGKDL